jgi:hypothetical protein
VPVFLLRERERGKRHQAAGAREAAGWPQKRTQKNKERGQEKKKKKKKIKEW